MKKSLCIVLLVSLLSGCASMSDRERTQAQGTGVGAVLGAVVGGVVGHQLGYRDAGILVGAALGGAAGRAYGGHIASKKEEFASQEDYLDACLAEARKQYQEARAYNDKLYQDIARLNRELDELLTAGQRSRSEQAALRTWREQVQARIRSAEEQVEALNVEITIQNSVVAQEETDGDAARIAQLRSEIRNLEALRDELREGASQLAAMNNRAAA